MISNMDKKLEARADGIERTLAIKNENMELVCLAKYIEIILNKHRTSAFEFEVERNDVEIVFDWEYYYGWFVITPIKDGGYTVEDEYYVEMFDTAQQVVDYLLKKDNDNAR